MIKKINGTLSKINNYVFSFFYQISKLRFIKKEKLFNIFFILMFFFIIMGSLFLGTGWLILELFKLLRIV